MDARGAMEPSSPGPWGVLCLLRVPDGCMPPPNPRNPVETPVVLFLLSAENARCGAEGLGTCSVVASWGVVSSLSRLVRPLQPADE